MHDHEHCVLFELALVKKHIILVIFIGGEHALGEKLLQMSVKIVPLFALVFLGRLHGVFQAQILHFERLFAHDLHKSHILEIRICGYDVRLGHVKTRAKFLHAVFLLRRHTKIQTVKINFDLLFVAIGQMLVDKQVVHERKRFHQKVALKFCKTHDNHSFYTEYNHNTTIDNKQKKLRRI